jgi:hypothetical protein
MRVWQRLFGRDKGVESERGAQAFQAYFQRLEPSKLKGTLVVHFGDLIQFDTLCAILTRSRRVGDLAYIAERFGPEFQWPGLQPHPIRFVRGSRSDGNPIARAFSACLSSVNCEMRRSTPTLKRRGCGYSRLPSRKQHGSAVDTDE